MTSKPFKNYTPQDWAEYTKEVISRVYPDEV